MQNYTTWIPPPKIIIDADGNKSCDWISMAIRPTVSKGDGVFSVGKNKQLDWIPFGGFFVNEEYVDIALQNSDHEISAYIVDAKLDIHRRVVGYLDGHPYYCPLKNAWIGSKMNMPSHGEEANAILRILPLNERKSMPNYPHINRNTIVFIELLRDIEDGEEIMYHYGWPPHRILAMLQRAENVIRPIDAFKSGITALISAAVDTFIPDGDGVIIDAKSLNDKSEICKNNAINTHLKVKNKKEKRKNHWALHAYRR